MASNVQQIVTSLQQNDYGSLVVIAAVGYDYILTFSMEIEYIWSKPWSWVSTLFVLARYFGMCSMMCAAFCVYQTSNIECADLMQHRRRGKFVFSRTCKDVSPIGSVSGARANWGHLRGNAMFFLYAWTFWVFTCSADLLMILRLWALYDRSKLILGILLVFYAIEVLSYLVTYIMLSTQYTNNPDPVALTTQVLNFTFCEFQMYTPVQDQVLDAFQLSLGAVMCLLVIVRIIKESIRTYKLTKRVQMNRYVIRLAREGMVYFIAILVYALINVLGNAGSIPTAGWDILLTVPLQEIPSVTLIPRFMLSLRELYDQDSQGRRGTLDMDTAFGFGHGANTIASTIMFAGDGQDEEGDEIQTEERVRGTRHASSSGA